MAEVGVDWEYYDNIRAELVERYKRKQKCHYFHSKLETYLQAIKHTLPKREVFQSSTPLQDIASYQMDPSVSIPLDPLGSC